MSLLAQVNNAISTGRLSAPLARALRRVARGPQVLLQREILIPVNTLVAQDFHFVDPFALPGVTSANTTIIINQVLLTVVNPSPAGAYAALVGTTQGGNQLLLSQAFPNPQTRGDTRGVLVAELGASLPVAANYRGVFAGNIDIWVRVTASVLATGGKLKLTITGSPLLP